MNGTSGYISIMGNDLDYLTLSKIEKLKYDLHCLQVAGLTGPSTGFNPLVVEREKFIDDIKRQIKNIERFKKIQKINK